MCINSKIALIWTYYAGFLSELKILQFQLEKKIAVSVHHMHWSDRLAVEVSSNDYLTIIESSSGKPLLL